MINTYEEIDAEWERLVASLGRECPAEGEAIMKAFMQHTAGLIVKARCMHCGELLNITERGTVWLISCPCGRSKDTLKGL
jgi:hypothetical protein